MCMHVSFSIFKSLQIVGMILWQLFTREEPYQGLTPTQIQTSVTSTHLRPSLIANMHKGLNSTLSPIPFTFAKLMQSCWAIEAEFRPPMATITKILSQPIERLFTYSAPTNFGESGLTFHNPTTSTSVPSKPATSTPSKTATSAPSKVSTPPPTSTAPVKNAPTNVASRKSPELTPVITVTSTTSVPSAPVTPKAQLSEEDIEKEKKVRAVIDKIKELIVSPSDIAQIRAANAITSFAKIQSQVSFIVESGLISDLCLLLLSKLVQVKEAAFNTLVSLCEHGILSY